MPPASEQRASVLTDAPAAAASSARVWPALRASFALLRARPVVTLALGAAVVLSLLSVCCGVGIFTTPWFMCELFALQLFERSGKPAPRQLSWLSAGAVLLGAVLLVSSVAWLTLLGSSPELAAEIPRASSVSALMKSGGFFAALGSVIAVLFILPFLYSPLILIEERARFDMALLESVRRVVSGGVLAHAGFSLFAHALQLLPAMLAALISLIFDPSRLPLLVLCSTPLLCATVPLGQGMIVVAYLDGRRSSTAIASSRPEPGSEAEEVRRLTGRYAFSWLTLLLLPLFSVLVLGISLVRPSRIAYGHAPKGVVVAELRPNGRQLMRTVVADTALEVSADRTHVRVSASDGGGAGELPLRAQGDIDSVRVLRVRDAYALEVLQGKTRSLTFVDRAGVRLDDDLRVRLFDRVPGAALAFVLLTLLCTALLTLPVLAGLARVRRGYMLPPERRPSADLLALDLAQSLRRAQRSALLLIPLAVVSIYFALRGLGLL